MNFKTVDQALDFAIKGEEESYQFYTDLAGRVQKQWIGDLFKSFAREEKGHKAKLQAVKEGKLLLHAEGKIQDLKIAEYVVEQQPSPELDYQQALILAMKKEKKAFKLYTDLAGTTEDKNLKETFLALAQEEAKHKLRFEIEYDEHVLTEN